MNWVPWNAAPGAVKVICLPSPRSNLLIYRLGALQLAGVFSRIFLSQPFFVAEQFTGRSGKYVKLADTVRSFREILDGKYDHVPEGKFYMVGSIEEILIEDKQ